MLQIQNFNPRSHEGSDGRNVLLPPAILYFNPRSHEGSDTDRNCKSIITKISIHAPTKGATCDSSSSSSVTTDFNPRSHEGSDEKDDSEITAGAISIHAPTKGATPVSHWKQCSQQFQSTLPRRERLSCGSLAYFLFYFNPRSHEGSDGDRGISPPHSLKISIHAPTKGATMRVSVSGRIQTDFNPRSHEGSDL